MNDLTEKIGTALVCASFVLMELIYWALQMGLVFRIGCCVLILLYVACAVAYSVYIWRLPEQG